MPEPKTVAEFDREISRLQEGREKAARDEAIFKALPLNQRVAIVLHTNLCHTDHTEGCGWYYEVKDGVHDFSGRGNGSHQHWLSRADKTLKSLRLAAPELKDDQKLAVIEAVTARTNY